MRKERGAIALFTIAIICSGLLVANGGCVSVAFAWFVLVPFHIWLTWE